MVVSHLFVSVTVSVWVLAKADSERIWVQLIHLGGDPGVTVGGWGNEARKTGQPCEGSVIQPVSTVATWTFIPLGTLGSQCRTFQSYTTWGTWELQTLCHKSGWGCSRWHWFWALLNFWVWTLVPEKAISKEVWSFLAGHGPALNGKARGIWPWGIGGKPSASAVVSIQRH